MTTNIRIDDKLSYLMVIVLSCFLFINTFSRSSIESLIVIGEMTIDLTLFFMIVMLIRSWLRRTFLPISLFNLYIVMFLMGFMFFLSFLISPYMTEWAELIRLFLLLIFIAGAARFEWNQKLLNITSVIFGVLTVFFFYDWMQAGFPLTGFKSIYRNENYLGILLFSLLYFHIIRLRFSKHLERFLFLIITILNLILIFATSARSILIALFSLLVFWTVLKFRRQLFKKLIYFVILGNFLFIGFYVWLSHIKLGVILNDLSRMLFNKNLFSGRTEIWIQVMEQVKYHPFFGYGIGVKASDITSIPLTSHNMYLQILMEFGLIGVIMFVLLLIFIWQLLTKRLDHFIVRFSSCFMLSILVYLSFELTLFQNNYSIAFFQWMIMTVGINFNDEY